MEHIKEYSTYLLERDESYNKSHPDWYIANISHLIRKEAEMLSSYFPEGWTLFNTNNPYRPVCLTDGEVKIASYLLPNKKDRVCLEVLLPGIPGFTPPDMVIEGIVDEITGIEQEDSKMLAKKCIDLIGAFIEKRNKRKRSAAAFGRF
jgi:hypothetical protein